MAIKFDIPQSKVPAFAKVVKATLSLYKLASFSEAYLNGPKSLYEIKRDWSEGSAGWLNHDSAQAWLLPGGDFDSLAPVAHTSDTSFSSWDVFDVTKSVQGFVNNDAANHGFILKFDTLPHIDTVYLPQLLGYASSNDTANPDSVPRLTITFEGVSAGTSFNRPTLSAPLMYKSSGALLFDFSGLTGSSRQLSGTVYTPTGRKIAGLALSDYQLLSIPVHSLAPGLNLFLIEAGGVRHTLRYMNIH